MELVASQPVPEHARRKLPAQIAVHKNELREEKLALAGNLVPTRHADFHLTEVAGKGYSVSKWSEMLPRVISTGDTGSHTTGLPLTKG